MIENEYCFAVSWDDDDKAEPYVIRATDRDKAWGKLCVKLSKSSYPEGYYGNREFFPEHRVSSVELQFVKIPEDRRRKFCHECGERLGANPVIMDGYYWHEECAEVEDERKARD